MGRTIIVVDMDAFFASVEQRDNTDLRGKPIAVGSTERRGVVATCSYEARAFGVRQAMPSWRAKKLCPELVFVYPRMGEYAATSDVVKNILRRYTSIVEMASIDEAYLDITEMTGDPVQTALRIKEDISAETGGLTASVGISCNKFLAKVASGMNKPDGLTEIVYSQVSSFLSSLPIEKFRGVGKITLEKMRSIGILTGADLRAKEMSELVEVFGEKHAEWFYNLARGKDDRPVETEEEPRKSLNVHSTYRYNVRSNRDAAAKIREALDEAFGRMDRYDSFGRTITLRAKYPDYRVTTRTITYGIPIKDRELAFMLIIDMLKRKPLERPVRMFGISVSNFDRGGILPSLWE
jgi:DNA polymerase-4